MHAGNGRERPASLECGDLSPLSTSHRRRTLARKRRQVAALQRACRWRGPARSTPAARRVHAHRVAGGGDDHRHSHGPFVAGRERCPGSGPPLAVHEQPQAARHRLPRPPGAPRLLSQRRLGRPWVGDPDRGFHMQQHGRLGLQQPALPGRNGDSPEPWSKRRRQGQQHAHHGHHAAVVHALSQPPPRHHLPQCLQVLQLCQRRPNVPQPGGALRLCHLHGRRFVRPGELLGSQHPRRRRQLADLPCRRRRVLHQLLASHQGEQ